MGLSYYEVESAYLFFMPSAAEAHDFELLSRGLLILCFSKIYLIFLLARYCYKVYIVFLLEHDRITAFLLAKRKVD